VSELILKGKPIASASIPTQLSKNSADGGLRPGWALQRLYAEKVLKMSTTLLNKIEEAAQELAKDPKAVSYCLFEDRLRITRLAREFKVPAEACAVFADSPSLWADYLRAAVLWGSKGNAFPPRITVTFEPGPTEQRIKDVATRLRAKHDQRRLAMMLSKRNLHDYRTQWIRLLKDGACAWDDFLAFNPLDEALSVGGYYRTRVLQTYLVAYLFACASAAGEEDIIEEKAVSATEENDYLMVFENTDEVEET
jgi:hypothetical protein